MLEINYMRTIMRRLFIENHNGSDDFINQIHWMGQKITWHGGVSRATESGNQSHRAHA